MSVFYFLLGWICARYGGVVQKTTICLVNKGVSRLLLQNQTFLSKIRFAYADKETRVKLSLPSYLLLLTEFDVVPTLCTREQAESVFELVNVCDEYVGGVVVDGMRCAHDRK